MTRCAGCKRANAPSPPRRSSTARRCVRPIMPARAGARQLLAPALRWLRCVWADQGYDGPELAAWVAAHRKTGTLRLAVVPRLQSQRGFVILARRGIVERTFGRFMQQRRLVRDYETKPPHAEAWIYVPMIGVMLRRLA